MPSWSKRDPKAENIYAEARSENEAYARTLEPYKYDEATRDSSPPAAPPAPASALPSPAPPEAEDEATRDSSPPAAPPASGSALPSPAPPEAEDEATGDSSPPAAPPASGSALTPPAPPEAEDEATRDSSPLVTPAATPIPMRHEALCSALEPLAASLAPLNKTVVECGDGGTCGPNSLGHALSHAQLHDGGGEEVRRRVVAHATALLRAKAVWCEFEATSVRQLIESSFATWALAGSSVNRVGGAVDWGGPRQVLTAENWLKLMASNTTWIDEGFLALAADCFAVDIRYSVVTSAGEIRGSRVVEPRATVDAQAEVELAYVVDRHFCAIVPTDDGGGTATQRSRTRDLYREARRERLDRDQKRPRRRAERPPNPEDGSQWWLRGSGGRANDY